MSQDLSKAYDASLGEDAIYAAWEASGFFNPDRLPERYQGGEPYAIMMPPPNVTGILHLGHALENALMDVMARYQRLRGKRVLLMPGTDHAAIATQARVEKKLIAEGVAHPRETLGREKLLEEIRVFAEGSKATILGQIRKMGTSCDWSRLAYTFDDVRNVAVNELFRRMYEDGLIYRGYRVVHWSVKGQSTHSDDEIVFVERPSILYTFKYNKDFPITISSTRPETKLGDTAVAVHPDDARYQQYVGRVFTVDLGAETPLRIRIIADDGVDPEFGTGALGVTPAHSPIDFGMFEKQKAKGEPIDLIPVIGKDGRMTQAAGPAYEGKTAQEARALFVAWLKERDLLIEEQEVTQSVGTSDRYGDVIESIPMTQWWLDVNKQIPGRHKTLRDLMREAVTSGLNAEATQKVHVTPERFTKLYLDRVEHLRDWCLSRQLWWGHRIPAWYRGEEIAVGQKPEGEGWTQEEDTLDTWFSSGSWTFSTLGWPGENADLTAFHPTKWIQMGYEILYLWLMRMILMSTYALKQIPFSDVYIHGILRDKEGKKFSKSSDNGIDPLTIIKEYGCDALRLSLLTGTTPGNDARYYVEKVEAARNLVNKIWNISRFVFTTVGGARHVDTVKAVTMADRWILIRFEATVSEVEVLMEHQDFSLALEKLRAFTWSDFADSYLEIAKVEKDKEDLLLFLLERLLVVWHPFAPFVTETIYDRFDRGMVMVAPWPTFDALSYDRDEMQRFEILRLCVTEMRRLRAEQNTPPSKEVLFCLNVPQNLLGALAENRSWMQRLTRAESLRVVETLPVDWPVIVSGPVSIALNVEEAVDQEAEKEKAHKDLAEVEQYVASLEQKLTHDAFVRKAPAHVVETMRKNLGEARAKHEVLSKKIGS